MEVEQGRAAQRDEQDDKAGRAVSGSSPACAGFVQTSVAGSSCERLLQGLLKHGHTYGRTMWVDAAAEQLPTLAASLPCAAISRAQDYGYCMVADAVQADIPGTLWSLHDPALLLQVDQEWQPEGAAACLAVCAEASEGSVSGMLLNCCCAVISSCCIHL